MDAEFTIGHLARDAGVKVQTVRYYEERGLIPAPRRSPAGYRLYGPEYVERIRFVKRAQELGFTLAEAGATSVRLLAPERPQTPAVCAETDGFVMTVEEAMWLRPIPHEVGAGEVCTCAYRPVVSESS